MAYPDGLYWRFTNRDLSLLRDGGLELPKEMILEMEIAAYMVNPRPINKTVSLDVVKITQLGLPRKPQPFFTKNDFFDSEGGVTDEIYEIITSDGIKSSVIRTSKLGQITIEEFLDTDITLHCRVAKNPKNYPTSKESKTVPHGVVMVSDQRCGCEDDNDKEVHEKRLAAQKDALMNRWHMLQPI